MPEGAFQHQSRDQAANSVLRPGKYIGEEWPAEAFWASSEADSVARASGTHFPQQVPTPNSRVRSRTQVAPFFTAERMCRSDTALQTQIIMGLL
jgi:hypothetical protein